MCEAEGIRNLDTDRRLCPAKAVEAHRRNQNLDVPHQASHRHTGMERVRTRMASALIVVSCPNEKGSSPSPPQLTTRELLMIDLPHSDTLHRLTCMTPMTTRLPHEHGNHGSVSHAAPKL
jgi:hypothetical protein